MPLTQSASTLLRLQRLWNCGNSAGNDTINAIDSIAASETMPISRADVSVLLEVILMPSNESLSYYSIDAIVNDLRHYFGIQMLSFVTRVKFFQQY